MYFSVRVSAVNLQLELPPLFSEELIKSQNITQMDFRRLERGLQTTPCMRSNYLNNDARVWRIWRNIAEGRITVDEFLNQALYLIHTLKRDFRQQPGQEQEDIELPVRGRDLPVGKN